ncbi:MAG: hypothetical protein H6861_02510 [Rhodospirillales bacterium]|nr:hypothetical protein [Rhodospirillales bacterium]
MKLQKNRQSEKGNVLFLILIAVALFAALSYAVTQSSRSGGGASDGEANLVNSAQITQYPASVRTAIVRMIIGGTDVAQLNFDPPSAFGTAVTGCDQASVSSTCVFHPDGGGATRVTAPPEVMGAGTQGEWVFSSNYSIANIGRTTAVNNSNDIIAFLPGVSQSLCDRLNTELGINVNTDADSDGVPDAGSTNIPDADEEMNQDSASGLGIGPASLGAGKRLSNDLSGQPFGCADFTPGTDETDDSDLVYFHVLVER